MFIRKDDLVEVTCGDDKGKRGKVLRVVRADAQGFASHGPMAGAGSSGFC